MSKEINVTEKQALDAMRTLLAYFSGTAAAEPVAEKAVPEAVAAEAPKRRGRPPKVQPEPEPEPEEEEAEEEEGFDAAELQKKTLRALKKMAVEVGYDMDDLDGYDKDDVIALLMEENGEEAEEEEEDEEEEDEEESEDDEDTITEDDLRLMSLAELKALAKEEGFTVKAGSNKDAIIDMLLGD